MIAAALARDASVRVDVGARRPGRSSAPESIGRRVVDVADERAARAALSLYDLVVIAIGPFERFGSRAHKLCIEAGVGCIDINDSFDVARDVFALSDLAERNGVLTLTGMGLSPGLTTLLLLDVLEAERPTASRIRQRLFVGGDQQAGIGAIRAMLSSFADRVPEVRDGDCVLVASDDESDERLYAFGFDQPPVRVVHYSTPEAWTLPRARPDLAATVGRFDYRVHFEGMPLPFVSLLRHAKLLRTPAATAGLSHVVHAVHDLGRRRRTRRVVARVEATAGAGVTLASAEAGSSYEATASFAAAIGALALNGGLDVSAGVHSLESAMADRRALRAQLGSRGIDLVTPA